MAADQKDLGAALGCDSGGRLQWMQEMVNARGVETRRMVYVSMMGARWYVTLQRMGVAGEDATELRRGILRDAQRILPEMEAQLQS